MRRSITLAALIGIGGSLGTADRLQAQTTGNVAPVPGPYLATPATGTLAHANPAGARALPYWMRSQPGTSGPTAPVFIPGWVWSPGRVTGTRGQGSYPAQPGAGAWPGPQPPAYGAAQWGPPGYAPGNWPDAPYYAPRGYGAPQQPQR